MSRPTIKSLTEQLETGEKQYQVLRKEKNAIQSLLDTANATVAELMNEVETLKELAHTRLHELTCKAASLKSLHSEHDTLKSNYAELEGKYYNVYTDYSNINAENHALKAEIERTNRHINLAENVIHEAKEQQPLVVNHYHNCTINK